MFLDRAAEAGVPNGGTLKLLLALPQGCLLIQAGAQMEWLTGGAVKAGHHEVCAVLCLLGCAEGQACFSGWRVEGACSPQSVPCY